MLDDFRNRLCGLDAIELGKSRVGLAVSGGGDSVAMLHILAEMAPASSLSVLTVNHNLRPEASAECAMVQSQCAGLGISCDIVEWTWDDVGNLQDAARRGRWNLIRDWTKKLKLDCVMVGHTVDDQVENFLMRLSRGSGLDGLSGMRAVSERDGIKLIRPILDLRRDELRQFLTLSDVAWADDPSNEDTKYSRVRARKMFKTLQDLGLTQKRVLQTVAHLQASSDVLEIAKKDFVTTFVTQDRGDLVVAATDDTPAFKELKKQIVVDAVRWVGGSTYKPRHESLVSAINAVEQQGRTTLGGCVLSIENKALRITREESATQINAMSDCKCIWDGRWEITGPSEDGSQNLTLKALGEEGVKFCPDWRQTGLPRHSLYASPSVWSDDTLIAAPIAGYSNGWTAQITADFVDWLVTH